MTSPTASNRVVLDTNVIIAAGSRWLANETPQPTSPTQRLVYCVANQHDGLYCDKILEEYVETLRERNHPADRIARYLAFIKSLFTQIAIASTTCHTPPSDPDDLVFILCALDGNAEVLVSDDNHLLVLQTAYHPCPAILPSSDACTRLGVLP